MNKYARVNQSPGHGTYFKRTLLVGILLNSFTAIWFTIDAALEHAVGPHKNRAGNVSLISSCFLHLEHGLFVSSPICKDSTVLAGLEINYLYWGRSRRIILDRLI